MEFLMNIKQFLILSCVGICLLGLSGCAGYRARPLNRLAIMPQAQEPSVSFRYRAFSKADCRRFLDRDVIAKGYQPIHVTISNNSNRYFNFSLENMSVSCVDGSHVAKEVHTSTITRVASYGIGSLFFPPLLIPAVIDGIGSSHANQKLDMDFEYKSLRNQVISPFATINGLIFVPIEEYSRDFTLALTDAQTHERVILGLNNGYLKG
jgi:hypothetical protein